jgi:hypothetical protein
LENFGILCSVPVALLTCMAYCRLLAKVVRRLERARRWHARRRRDQPLLAEFVRRLERVRRLLYWASFVILGLFLVELVLLSKLGAVHSRAVIGPGFYVGHVLVFFLGPPALANALVLRENGTFVARWYFAGAICTIFAFYLVLLQYDVSESLYGLNGTDGPYS